MERSMREEDFDWLMAAQNPTANARSAQDYGYSHQQPPLTTTVGSSSTRHVNGNAGFLGGFSFQNEQQQQLPAMGTNFGANPIRSIFEYRDRFPAFDFCRNYRNNDSLYSYGDFHPGLASFDHQSHSSLNGFPQTPCDRNLEIDFGRLSISSPNHHHLLPFLPSPPPLPASNIRNNSFNTGNVYPHGRVPAPVTFNRNTTGFHDQRWNLQSSRRESFQLNKRGFSNVLDQNPIRSRDWARDYVNYPSSNYHLFQPRQQQIRPKFPESLEDIKGLILFVAKDPEGGQFLQTKCEKGNPEDIEMIFNETKDHLHQLMVDVLTNMFAQTLFKVCNERQMTHFVFSLITDDGSLTSICVNSNGTRAMQKLIELVTTAEQRALIVSALRRITLTLSKNMNGHHVIQCCVKSFHVDEVQPILDVVADNCMDIATDKSGCCVLQQCVLHANGICKERLMSDIIANALHLSEHPFGNYVVQHLLGMRIPEATSDIIQMLSGNFIALSLNKYGSNVVEKCLKDAADDQSISIIEEFINSQNLLTVIQHPFGNYVAQAVLRAAKGPHKEMMIKKVQKEYAFINSHPHGKRVLVLAQDRKPRVSIHA